MKIIYTAIIGSDIGVLKKISSQINSLNKLGIETIGYLYGLVSVSRGDLPQNIKYRKINPSKGDLLYSMINTNELILIKESLKYLELEINSIKYDYIYFRYPFADPYVVKFMMKYGNKVIFEFQSIVLEEMRMLKKRKQFIMFEKYLVSIILRKALGFVGVTKEITEYYKKVMGCKNTASITLTNGIDVSSLPLRNGPKYDGRRINMICVANVQKWQGLDRLIRGMASYSMECNRLDINLHIVGYGKEIPRLKAMAKRFNIKDKVIFHGILQGDELSQIFDECHIAIGALGVHRKKMKYASTLKVREYMARGIPFILSHIDDDIRKRNKYVLQIQGDNSNIDIKNIINFTERVFRCPNYIDNMREYANSTMDMDIKMSKLLNFINDIN